MFLFQRVLLSYPLLSTFSFFLIAYLLVSSSIITFYIGRLLLCNNNNKTGHRMSSQWYSIVNIYLICEVAALLSSTSWDQQASWAMFSRFRLKCKRTNLIVQGHSKFPLMSWLLPFHWSKFCPKSTDRRTAVWSNLDMKKGGDLEPILPPTPYPSLGHIE